jgi:hypothetical protein
MTKKENRAAELVVANTNLFSRYRKEKSWGKLAVVS